MTSEHGSERPPSKRPATRTPEFFLAAVLCAAAATRFFRLGHQSLWFDEVFSLDVVEKPFSALISEALRDAVHPPLYYILLKPFAMLSESEWILRLPSALLGIAFVALMYAVVADMLNRRVAGVAAVICLLSPFHVFYSQETRMYTLLMVMALLSTFLLHRANDREQRAAWTMYSFSIFLLLMTHYVAVGLVVAHGIWAILTGKRRKASQQSGGDLRSSVVTGWMASVAVAGLLSLPWMIGILQHGQKLGERAEDGSPEMAIYSLVGTFLSFNFGYFEGLFREGNLVLALVGVASLAALIFWWQGVSSMLSSRNQRAMDPSALILLSLIGATAFSFLVAVFSIFHLPRYYSAAYPFGVIVMAAGIVAMWERRRPPAVIGGALLLTLWCIGLRNYYCNPVYAREDWRSVSRFMQRHKRPDDVLVFNAAYEDIPFRHYFRDTFRKQGLPSVNRPSEGLVEKEARPIVVDTDSRRYWLILCYDHITDPQSLVRKWFDANLRRIEEHSFSQIDVILYEDAGSVSR